MQIDWDTYLMSIASLVSVRSPDPSTKHGCVIVDRVHRIRGLGYNGFPRGSSYNYPTTRPEKYRFIVHAELNAILNCQSLPIDCTAYVTGMPCSRCMVSMIQAGIICIKYGNINSACVDIEDENASKLLSKNHGVQLEKINVDIFSVFDMIKANHESKK